MRAPDQQVRIVSPDGLSLNTHIFIRADADEPWTELHGVTAARWELRPETGLATVDLTVQLVEVDVVGDSALT